MGKWKVHFPHTYPHVVNRPKGGKPGQLRTAKMEPRSLFDLEQDMGEKTNVAEAHPDVVRGWKNWPTLGARTWATQPAR